MHFESSCNSSEEISGVTFEDVRSVQLNTNTYIISGCDVDGFITNVHHAGFEAVAITTSSLSSIVLACKGK